MAPGIRPFTAEDYEAVVAVNNAAFPEYPGSVEEWRFWDENRDPKCEFARWVAEQDGTVVGYIQHMQLIWMYHPRKFMLEGAVHPEYWGQGIGTALYDQVLAGLARFDPLVVRLHVREDRDQAMRFLDKRGYKEEMRAWESRLDVAAFDPGPYEGAEERMRAAGLTIKTFRELEADAGRNEKLCELENTLSRDVPQPDEHTDVTLEQFMVRLSTPNLLPDAFFVALDGDHYVGLSALWNNQGSDDLYNGLTGVRREYRRKGIALALKLRGIAWARAQGRRTIKTWNESNNRPMLSINERLGFVRQPAWLNMVKVLKEE
jgi:GNAT superfamily N-acetyltransferase